MGLHRNRNSADRRGLSPRVKADEHSIVNSADSFKSRWLMQASGRGPSIVCGVLRHRFLRGVAFRKLISSAAVVERMDIRKIERSYSRFGRIEYPPRILLERAFLPLSVFGALFLPLVSQLSALDPIERGVASIQLVIAVLRQRLFRPGSFAPIRFRIG